MYGSKRLLPLLVLGIGVGITACSDSVAGPTFPGTFEVTITNLTSGQPFTPPLAATHGSATSLYVSGSPASTSLRELAENGNLGPMQADLDGSTDVAEVVIAVAGDPPPLMPGQSVTFSISADEDAPLLSFAAMLICTNDGFTGVDAISLPTQMGQQVTRDLDAYDAGTEINTEDFANLVPPCPPLTGQTSTVPGSGVSEPALAEGDVVRGHAGIVGGTDLLTGVHGWTDPVARITITRTN